MASNQLDFQNFFSTTLSGTITASDTVIYLNSLPTPSEGYLVLEPDSESAREIIYYTSKGVNYVTCPSVADGRGVGGTSAAAHSNGATVQMNVVAEDLREVQNGNANTGLHTYFDESFNDYILSGGTIAQASGLIASISSGVAYINGRRLPFNAMSKTFTASRDTYVDLIETDGSNIATISYTELVSGATGSNPVSNGVHIGMIQSHTASLTRLVQSGTDILGNSLKPTTPEKQALDANVGRIAYTPVWANTTLGNGTSVGYYTKIGRTVHFWAAFNLGSTSAMGTGPSVTLPVTASSTPNVSNYPVGTCVANDAATATYMGGCLYNTTTTCIPVVSLASGTYAVGTIITATVPFTWTTGDFIAVQGTYESAA